MKKYIIGVCILVIGLIIGAFLMPCQPKIAIVNVNKVVRAYPKFSLVQRENALKIGELSQWIDATQKKIDAEKDKAKKAELIKQTQTVVQQKKAAIQQEYNQKTLELDKEITDAITKTAQKNGFQIVFSSKSIVSGGIDITDQVLEKFKEEKK